MTQYASKTRVSPGRTRDQLEHVLKQYGADAFGYAWDGDQAKVNFRLNARTIRLTVQMPDRSAFRLTPTRRVRAVSQQTSLLEQAQRQRWRALFLVIKAKLEAIESGISTLEEEFLAWTVLPNNATVWEMTHEPIKRAIESGQMPKLLASKTAGGGFDG